MRGTASGLAGALENIRAADKEAERKAFRAQVVALSGLLAMPVGLMVAVFALPALGIPLAAIGLPTGIVGVVLYHRFKQGDVDDRRYELAERILRALAKDMGPGDRFEVFLDLGRSTDRRHLTGTGKANGLKIKYFDHPWLLVRARFLDGTSCQLLVRSLFQRRSGWRTRRGKTKYTVKVKESALVAELQLRPKRRKVPRLAELKDSAKGAVRLPSRVVCKQVSVDGKKLSLRVKLKPPWVARRGEERTSDIDAGQTILMMYLSLFQILNLARAVEKKTA